MTAIAEVPNDQYTFFGEAVTVDLRTAGPAAYTRWPVDSAEARGILARVRV
jgi:hypothetical protein